MQAHTKAHSEARTAGVLGYKGSAVYQSCNTLLLKHCRCMTAATD